MDQGQLRSHAGAGPAGLQCLGCGGGQLMDKEIDIKLIQSSKAKQAQKTARTLAQARDKATKPYVDRLLPPHFAKWLHAEGFIREVRMPNACPEHEVVYGK